MNNFEKASWALLGAAAIILVYVVMIWYTERSQSFIIFINELAKEAREAEGENKPEQTDAPAE